MVVLFEDPRQLPLATFLMQVFITLVVCKILAKLLSYIRQPQVIGQIIAGIIFGPSILGILIKRCNFSSIYTTSPSRTFFVMHGNFWRLLSKKIMRCGTNLEVCACQMNENKVCLEYFFI